MPVGPVELHQLDVTQADADEFMQAFKAALDRLPIQPATQLYLFPKNRKALSISLDGDLKPFLGFTAGYNPPEQRVYLPDRIQIIDRISEILESYDRDTRGGRIFLTEYSVSKEIEGHEHTLCTYDWPGEGPYSIGLRLYKAKLTSSSKD